MMTVELENQSRADLAVCSPRDRVPIRAPGSSGRVMHVVHWPGVTGINLLLRGLLERMIPAGFESHVVCMRGDVSAKSAAVVDFESIAASVRYLNAERVGGGAFASIDLRRAVREVAPDILHTHSFQPVIWGSLCPIDQRRHITTVHTDYPYFTRRDIRSRLKRTLEIGVLQRVPIQIVAVGHKVHRLMIELGVPRERLTLIENGVDVDRWPARGAVNRQARLEVGISPDDFLLVTVGRLDVRTKAHDLLLKAVAELRKTRPQLKLLLIGDGPDRALLEAMVCASGLTGAVYLLGHVPDSRPFLDMADAYISSSIVEGFGLAVVEAMLRGLPTIATDVGVAPEAIETGITGVLAVAGDVSALIRAIGDVIDGRYDLAAMGRRGEQSARLKYDLKVTANGYMDFYGRVLAGIS